jgi:hypothetical protein
MVDATGGFDGFGGFVTGGGSGDDHQSLHVDVPGDGGTGQMPPVVAD